MQSYEFKLFVPPNYSFKKLDKEQFEALMQKKYVYCSRGRHAIYHALKSLKISGKVVIPCYACHTIRDSIIAAGLEYITCDINANDLNIDFDALNDIVEKNTDIECVIVASLYGNPADLLKIQNYCREKGIKMIDDGAQSFGAKIGEQYVSTFGDAGLIAFSPGKATPAPMGALLFCDENYSWNRTRHHFVHKILYLNYSVNRLGAYKKIPQIYRKIISKTSMLLEHYINIRNDAPSKKEMKVIGGVIEAALTEKFEYRNRYYNMFCERFSNTDFFRIVNNQRGQAVHPKIVILAANKDLRDKMLIFLKKCKIDTYSGYPLIKNNENTPIADKICNCVLEMPIEDNATKMDYLFSCVEKFIEIERERI